MVHLAKSACLLGFVVFMGGSAPALAEGCEGLDQAALAGCVGEALTAADAELNSTFDAAMGALVDTPAQGQLRDAQRLWIPFRDAACAAEAAVYDGASVQPIARAQCLLRITLARTADLAAILNGDGWN